MPNIQALNVFVRYVPVGSACRAFYEQGVGLPLVRTYGANPADLFWGGEAVIFETIEVAGKAPDPQPDPAAASAVPIFLTPDLDRALVRLASRDIAPVSIEARGLSRDAYLVDPAGRLIALRERAAAAATAQDVEQRRRRARGEAFNPGCAAMPEDIQELGWIVRRVADVARMAGFYEAVIGLERLEDEDGRIRFDLGDNIVLELLGGGPVLPDAKVRSDNTDALLLRAGDTPALRRAFADGGGRVVTEKLDIYWADLAFLADPEGFVFGAEQAYHPGVYAPARPALTENLEAARRWRERVAVALAKAKA